LAGEKASFREAAILIFVGLSPSRSGVSLTLNLPNPGSEISSPFAAGLVMRLHLAHAMRLCNFAASSDVFTSHFLDDQKGDSIA
jgi:hypothetical protein